MSSQRRYRPNVTDVAAKVIDGEAIIMNLSSGLYFSMDRVGATVWELVERECSMQEIVDHVSRLYEADPGTAASDVAALVDRLVEENLVVEAPGSNGNRAPEMDAGSRGDYETPVLNRYDDMADLLALDPPMPSLGETDFEG